MSLANEKNALFGKDPIDTNSSKSKTSSTASKTASLGTGMSSAVKEKKLKEAAEYEAKAKGYLKTSFFNWNPDFLAAAPMFEKSSDLYKQVGEIDKACSLMKRCSECHEANGSLAACAVALMKTAQMLKTLGNIKEMVELLKQASNHYAINGELNRAGETLARAAGEIENEDKENAEILYNEAIEILLPSDTPVEQISQSIPQVVDVIRKYFTFLIKDKYNLPRGLEISNRLIQVSDAFELESSACKAMLCTTIIQIALNDVEEAERTYLQVHLNHPQYLRSKECELADDLTRAYKLNDHELLEKCRKSPSLQFIDRAVAMLVKEFELPDVPKPEMNEELTQINSDVLNDEVQGIENENENAHEDYLKMLDNIEIGDDGDENENNNDAENIEKIQENDNESLPVPPPVVNEDDDEDEIDLS